MYQDRLISRQLRTLTQLLYDSDPILRIRALQRICNDYPLFTTDDGKIINTVLINRLDEETHPKVIRWIAYTLANINAGHAAEAAISAKMKQVSDNDVMEWLIASKEKLAISTDEKKMVIPIELHSKEDLLTGVIKSWAHINVNQQSIDILLKALNHPDAKIRRWAVLSIGNRKSISPNVKEAIKRCFDDDDYLVREWSMYAFRKCASEQDFEVYASELEREKHVRVREWVVKSLPHTQSRDVPLLLLHELENEKYTTDTLYTEAIITALSQYADRRDVRDKLISIIHRSNDDVILLATAADLNRQSRRDERIVVALHEAYKKAQSESVRMQIGAQIIDSLDSTEKERISGILKDASKKYVLKVALSLDRDSVLEQLLDNEGMESVHPEKTGVNRLKHTMRNSLESTGLQQAFPPDLDYNPNDQSWYVSRFPKTKEITKEEFEALKQPIDVVIVTAVKVELNAVAKLLKPLQQKGSILKVFLGPETHYIGKFGAYTTAVTKCRKGAIGVGSATLATNEAIDTWKPRVAIMIGIAFGRDPVEQKIGDVLVASEIISYEQQRVGKKIIHRGTNPPSNTTLLDRFENVQNWQFNLPDDNTSTLINGPILSGEKLVDDPDFKASLFDRFPEAIGGEMEGSGFCAAADRKGIPWILVKSICDWGDGRKNKKHQPLAAAAAVSLVHHVLGQRTVLDSFLRKQI